MPIHYIKDPQITINSVDLTDHVKSVEISQSWEDLDVTASGVGGKQRIAGLEDSSISVTFNQDYDASEVDATLSAIGGSAVAFDIRAGSAAVSATNPRWHGTVVVVDYKPIMGDIGAINETSIAWPVSGTVTRATA